MSRPIIDSARMGNWALPEIDVIHSSVSHDAKTVPYIDATDELGGCRSENANDSETL
jgi:hypothetical protein